MRVEYKDRPAHVTPCEDAGGGARRREGEISGGGEETDIGIG